MIEIVNIIGASLTSLELPEILDKPRRRNQSKWDLAYRFRNNNANRKQKFN